MVAGSNFERIDQKMKTNHDGGVIFLMLLLRLSGFANPIRGYCSWTTRFQGASISNLIDVTMTHGVQP